MLETKNGCEICNGKKAQLKPYSFGLLVVNLCKRCWDDYDKGCIELCSTMRMYYGGKPLKVTTNPWGVFDK